MTKYLLIVADHNDADWIRSFEPITDEELKLIQPVIDAIKKFKPYTGTSASGMKYSHEHNFPEGEYCHRPDLGQKSAHEMYGHIEGYETFYEMVPKYEGNIHTIESITVMNVSEEEKLL